MKSSDIWKSKEQETPSFYQVIDTLQEKLGVVPSPKTDLELLFRARTEPRYRILDLDIRQSIENGILEEYFPSTPDHVEWNSIGTDLELLYSKLYDGRVSKLFGLINNVTDPSFHFRREIQEYLKYRPNQWRDHARSKITNEPDNNKGLLMGGNMNSYWRRIAEGNGPYYNGYSSEREEWKEWYQGKKPNWFKLTTLDWYPFRATSTQDRELWTNPLLRERVKYELLTLQDLSIYSELQACCLDFKTPSEQLEDWLWDFRHRKVEKTFRYKYIPGIGLMLDLKYGELRSYTRDRSNDW